MIKKRKKAASITAKDDKGRSIRVRLEFVSEDGLCPDEVAEVRTRLARKIADAIRELPYSDFGPENTEICLLHRWKTWKPSE